MSFFHVNAHVLVVSFLLLSRPQAILFPGEDLSEPWNCIFSPLLLAPTVSGLFLGPIFIAFSYTEVCRVKGGSREALAAPSLPTCQRHVVKAPPPRHSPPGVGLGARHPGELKELISEGPKQPHPCRVLTGTRSPGHSVWWAGQPATYPSEQMTLWPLGLLCHLPPASFHSFSSF